MKAWTAGIWTVAGCLMLGTGCQKSPFSKELPRTPYERYQLLRGDAPPVYELDTYGNRRPALRARLVPNQRR
jgi:hypothetical protein